MGVANDLVKQPVRKLGADSSSITRANFESLAVKRRSDQRAMRIALT